jgi:hypothetical protein
MCRQDETEYVTYTIVTCSATETTPADTAKVKIPKFHGGSASAWLKWSIGFQSLVKKKAWTVDQVANQLLILIDGSLGLEVQRFAEEATEQQLSFDEYYRNIGMLMVPSDYCDDLDTELYTPTKRRDETVQQVSRHLKENVGMFAQLPCKAEVVPDQKQCRYLKRAMPREWQEKFVLSAMHCECLQDMIVYFDRLERSEKVNGRDKQSHKPNDKKNRFHKKESTQNQDSKGNGSGKATVTRTPTVNGARTTRLSPTTRPIALH